MNTRQPVVGRVRSALLVLVATLGLLGGLLVAPSASGANLGEFRPGNIISDGVFFNAGTMGEAQIQAWLEAKVPTCRSGYVCLKDWRDSSATRPADAMCGGYTGVPDERASTIIYRVAQACGINPQVILVTLQKEQGLVTNTEPSASRYRIAMGQGCPDTAACDTRYYGFFNQVYGAAWQFKRYANPPGTSQYFTWYAPGRTWDVRYHPNVSCGSSPVYIENQATANLYYYTPYQPNQSALAAGYGTGDACGAYGNRNFYQYFVDWFGSTRYAVVGGLADYWQARGGAGGYLGEATGNMSVWAGAGWSQPFAAADLLQQLGGSVYAVGGAFRAEYRVVGHFWSGLGWPTGEQGAVAGGWYQDFQGGRIYVRPDGRGVSIASPMNQAYESVGNITGFLGWPTSRAYRVANGSQQDFDAGSIYAGPTATIPLPKDVATFYASAGGPAGILGWPTSGVVADSAAGHVLFGGGWLQKTGSTFLLVKGSIGAAYVAMGGIAGPLGVATGPELFDGTGWWQDFAGGTLYSSAAGTWAVSALRPELASLGGVGAIGYPSGPEAAAASGVSQPFTRLTVGRSSSGTFIVKGAIGAYYATSGGAASPLGAPIGAEIFTGTGWTQEFAGGRIVCGPTGTFAIASPVTKPYDAAGGTAGRLGWPLTGTVAEAGGWRQGFQGGAVYANPTTGAPVVGAILGTYVGSGGPSALGFPIGSESLVPGSWRQQYERGAVYVPSAYPASGVSGSIYTLYSAMGADGGAGLPTGPRLAIDWRSGQQDFVAATIYESTYGTWYTRGMIRDVYRAWGGPFGGLSWPVQSEQAVNGGWRQAFVGGGVFVWAGGVFTSTGSLGREYLARGGESGALGWPTGNQAIVGGLWTQAFQNGTLVLQADGTFTVR